ncbi:hypothetical protein [Hoeflea sp.]|uniref:hypothetical protein n=1 Tax=Hoeflea sp. TaxID=1940281 RepID=UPI003A8E5310
MALYLPALFSLLGAVIGASLTGWFAIQRFRSERWWDRKYQAYSDVLEALNSIRADLEVSFEAHLTRRDVPKEQASALLAAYQDGIKSIEKQRAIGGLVLGDTVVAQLREFERTMQKASGGEHYFDYLDGSLAAVNECIATVISLGRDDLKASNKRNWRKS